MERDHRPGRRGNGPGLRRPERIALQGTAGLPPRSARQPQRSYPCPVPRTSRRQCGTRPGCGREGGGIRADGLAQQSRRPPHRTRRLPTAHRPPRTARRPAVDRPGRGARAAARTRQDRDGRLPRGPPGQYPRRRHRRRDRHGHPHRRRSRHRSLPDRVLLAGRRRTARLAGCGQRRPGRRCRRRPAA